MGYIGNIPYNPTNDPMAQLALALRNYDEGQQNKQGGRQMMNIGREMGAGLPQNMTTPTNPMALQLLSRLLTSQVMTPLQESQIKSNNALADWRKNRPAEGAAKPLTRANISTARTKANQIIDKLPSKTFEWGYKNFTKETMLRGYEEYRMLNDYDNLQASETKRLDKVWDKMVGFYNAGKKGKSLRNEYDWDPESAEVKDLRGLTPAVKTQLPHQALAPFWEGIDKEERQEITDALKANPNNITEILRILSG